MIPPGFVSAGCLLVFEIAELQESSVCDTQLFKMKEKSETVTQTSLSGSKSLSELKATIISYKKI